ncbi:MAG: hypothetical protein QF577_03570 [Phycisphaerae bacterium]|jgi:hypothetical protein|nr:hypothetical protein [Phycisphaerae bacterium]
MSNYTSQQGKDLIALATAAQAAGDTAQIAEIQAEFERRAAKRDARCIMAEDAGEKFEHHRKIAELARRNAAQVAAMAAPRAAMVTKPTASLAKMKKAELVALVAAMIEAS